MDHNTMGWIEIISKMYKDLHTSERVMRVAKESDKKKEIEKNPDKSFRSSTDEEEMTVSHVR